MLSRKPHCSGLHAGDAGSNASQLAPACRSRRHAGVPHERGMASSQIDSTRAVYPEFAVCLCAVLVDQTVFLAKSMPDEESHRYHI